MKRYEYVTTKTDLIRHWVEEVWLKDNQTILNEMFTPDPKASGPVSSQAGKDFRSSDIVLALKSLFQCTPEISYSVLEEAGDWVIVCFTLAVNEHPHRPSFAFDGQMMLRLKDDRIAEIHTSLDYIKMFEGLGQMPEDSLLIALTGAELEWK